MNFTDEWYTPPKIIQDLIDYFESPIVDYCTSPESIAYTHAGLRTPELYIPVPTHYMPWNHDVQFLNPPYSKASGGAEKFLREYMLCTRHTVALINMSPWVRNVVEDLGLIVGLIQGRVRFEAGVKLQEERLAKGLTPNPKSPQYNNLFLYHGPFEASDLPESLGGYAVTWLEQ